MSIINLNQILTITGCFPKSKLSAMCVCVCAVFYFVFIFDASLLYLYKFYFTQWITATYWNKLYFVIIFCKYNYSYSSNRLWALWGYVHHLKTLLFPAAQICGQKFFFHTCFIFKCIFLIGRMHQKSLRSGCKYERLFSSARISAVHVTNTFVFLSWRYRRVVESRYTSDYTGLSRYLCLLGEQMDISHF